MISFATRAPRRASKGANSSLACAEVSCGVPFGDGSGVLTTAEDRGLRVFETPCRDGTASISGPGRTFAQPNAVSAVQWYPTASALSPATYCFVASVRDTPVRLIDATDGRIRASYPLVDHRERFVAPYAMAFNLSADKLYCGMENAIEVFDVAEPGYGGSERLKTGLTRREKGGQRGIISALAFSAHQRGTFAAGSFSRTVVLYDEDTGARATGHAEGVVGGGVTQLAFHPLDPYVLFVASRRSTEIQAYDLRDLSAPVASLERLNATNQRLAFGLDPWGRYLAAGDEKGMLRVWDIASPAYDVVAEYKLHEDAINSVQFHPYEPLILTCSGSRAHLRSDDVEFDSDSDDTDSDDSSDEEAPVGMTPGARETGLSIWSFGHT